ncbi:hypothetical protein [Pseudomonas sp.]|uniref:hypothetical protein n=1 Tax=Pseudomonas sp. TaxID=306 RepID=UPI003C498234
MSDEKAIGADLDLCDRGLALTKGNRRRRFAKHRKACFAAIREMNAADGLDRLTDTEILAELEA